jgi:GNAT superfamily N-acetyltransferase
LVIFVAVKDGAFTGFTQLYRRLALARIFILSDVLVDTSARRASAGTALLQGAAEYGRRFHALRLVLSTEIGNVIAQSLYEKLGWKRNTEFCTYEITL